MLCQIDSCILSVRSFVGSPSVKISHLECQVQLSSLPDCVGGHLVIIQDPSGICTYQMN